MATTTFHPKSPAAQAEARPAALRPAPLSALLLFGGGLVTVLATFLPWASMSILSVSGMRAGWGGATFAAGLVAVAAGLHRLRTGPGGRRGGLVLGLSLLAGFVAVAVPAAVAGELHEPIVRRQLDAHLAPHDLEADDLLGGDRPSLFQQWAPMLSGQVADVVAAIETTMHIEVEAGLWLTMGGGASAALGAATGLAGRRRTRTNAA